MSRKFTVFAALAGSLTLSTAVDARGFRGGGGWRGGYGRGWGYGGWGPYHGGGGCWN